MSIWPRRMQQGRLESCAHRLVVEAEAFLTGQYIDHADELVRPCRPGRSS